jgi:DNA-binding NtrC family response regulator
MNVKTVRDAGAAAERPSAPPVSGVVIAFAGGAARCIPIPLHGELYVGRRELAAYGVFDDHASGRHLLVKQQGTQLLVEDLGSTNGTFLNGRPLVGISPVATPAVVRIGRTLMLVVSDVAPYQRYGLTFDGELILGPSLRDLHERVARLAAAGVGVLFTGESGAGKEIAARAYHLNSGRHTGPFVAVNCATIPKDLAESLLFGARRGAYSGAVADSEGYILAADGGTLFLDEIGELDASVQAKLLRVLETREVLMLGATKTRPVDLRLCAATFRDLRQAVVDGRFREDLYYRLGRPELRVPPLRERLEEIPALVQQTLRGVPGAEYVPTLALVEACLLGVWPGNVRELRAELRAAALEALGAGERMVDAVHLGPLAGQQLDPGPAEAEEDRPPITAESLREALEREGGNLSRTAKRVGVPRNTLRRLLIRHGIDLSAVRSGRDE